MKFVMILGTVLAVFWFDAAVAQEVDGQPDHLYCVVVPPEI